MQLFYIVYINIKRMSSQLVIGGVSMSSSSCCMLVVVAAIAYIYLQTNILGTNPMCTSSLFGGCITRDGLIGLYDSKTFKKDDDEWKDNSGKKNHAVISKGCKIDKDDGVWITGKSDKGIWFPEAILKEKDNYTLIHVTRYDGSNGNRKRIFGASDMNYLSGHHNKRSGVSHQEGVSWIVPAVDQSSREQRKAIISVEHRGEYAKNNNELTSVADTDLAKTPNNLGVNVYNNGSENSDWAIGMVLIYNKKLKESEVGTIITVLKERFKIEFDDDDDDDDD
jgi:hypothetical protein